MQVWMKRTGGRSNYGQEFHDENETTLQLLMSDAAFERLGQPDHIRVNVIGADEGRMQEPDEG